MIDYLDYLIIRIAFYIIVISVIKELISPAIYINATNTCDVLVGKLDQVNSEDALKFTWIEIHDLILCIA